MMIKPSPSLRILALTGFLLLLCSPFSHAQIQTPEQFLGYKPGDRFTPHHQMVAYFKHLAEEVPHLKLIQYGETNERRPLILAIVSSPENMAQLEELRKDNLRRAGLLEGTPSTNIPINWMSFNVHGNESTGMEAAISVIHTLVNPANDQVASWLKDQVIILDPCINPDGRDRYAMWYNQKMNRIMQPDMQSSEHNEPWPGGRANHYLFDLNRDWAWQVQVESQARLKIYQQWMPQLHLDFHEQGINSPFYMAPAAEPLHEQLSDWQHEFQAIFGKNTAKYFDDLGRFYFTKERFDLLYPSYGDTYPMYNGAIGMTIEQGGSGRAGRGGLNAIGDTVTLSHRIEGHYTAALSAVEMTSQHADRLLSEFATYFDENASNPTGNYKTFVLKGDSNPTQLIKLLELLDRNGIRYGKAGNRKGLTGYNYQRGATSSFSTTDADVIISAHQPKSVLTQVLFEPNPLLRDSITYDITSWALPYAYNVEAYALSGRMDPLGEYQPKQLESTQPDKTPLAYLAPWEGTKHVAFLAALLQEGIRVRFPEWPFRVENKRFPAGTLLITKGGNTYVQDFDKKVTDLANQFGIKLETTQTGYMQEGKDFGSSTVRIIQKPTVALVGGEGTSSLSYGEIWHFFEQDLGYPLVNLDMGKLDSYVLSNYDVLILPNLRARSWTKDLREKIQAWVKEGGKLIALEGALDLFADQDGFELKTHDTEEEAKEAEKTRVAIDREERLAPYTDEERLAISSGVTGAIFQIDLDQTHPLGYGIGETYYSLKNNSKKYAYLTNGENVGRITSNEAHRSGFVGHNIKNKFDASLAIGVEPMGKGEVIYFVDNPIFRGFWESGKLLLGNAVFLVGH